MIAVILLLTVPAPALLAVIGARNPSPAASPWIALLLGTQVLLLGAVAWLIVTLPQLAGCAWDVGGRHWSTALDIGLAANVAGAGGAFLAARTGKMRGLTASLWTSLLCVLTAFALFPPLPCGGS
jgi:hypothetical protein